MKTRKPASVNIFDAGEGYFHSQSVFSAERRSPQPNPAGDDTAPTSAEDAGTAEQHDPSCKRNGMCACIKYRSTPPEWTFR